MTAVRKALPGALLALGGTALLAALMVPLRSQLPVAVPGLVLAVPVVAGVAVGGLGVGLVAVVAAGLADVTLFMRPYDTLALGRSGPWLTLSAYLVVMTMVALLVYRMRRAQRAARHHEVETRRLYVLSDMLIGDTGVDELLARVVTTIQEASGCRWAAVLLPDGDDDERLRVVATAGAPLDADALARLAPAGGRPESLRVFPEPGLSDASGGAGDLEPITRLALSARGRPIGLVAMAGDVAEEHDWELLRTYANQAALALERGQLREQALRTELLEEADRWRAALMGAVSHDLRTPLASVKAAVTALRQPGHDVGPAESDELLGLIEAQSDALDRLVAGLLDVTRIESGALELRRDYCSVRELADLALAGRFGGEEARVQVRAPEDLPLVDVDPLLIGQVIANLVENALRHSPDDVPVEVTAAVGPEEASGAMTTHNGSRIGGGTRSPAEAAPATVTVSVRDHGPGIPADARDLVFRMFNPPGGRGRAGLGLAIARTFVEAHGGHISVSDAEGGGAHFAFTLPLADVPADGS